MVRGDRARHDPGGGDGPGDRGREAWRVGRHARFDLVVDDDPVAGVGDLAGVAELGRGRGAALADGCSVAIAERHQAGLAGWDLAGELHPGLGDHLADRIDHLREIGEHLTEPPQRPSTHAPGVREDSFRDSSDFTGE